MRRYIIGLKSRRYVIREVEDSWTSEHYVIDQAGGHIVSAPHQSRSSRSRRVARFSRFILFQSVLRGKSVPGVSSKVSGDRRVISISR